MKFTAVVPLYTDHKELKNNFTLLDNRPSFVYVFETLLQTPMIDNVICYCNNELVKDFIPTGVKFIKRDAKYDLKDANLIDILKSLCNQIQIDYIVLCAGTSPFISSLSIVNGIKSLISKEYDSAFSVYHAHQYAWFNNSPINYQINHRVNTAQIQPITIETKGFYIFNKNLIIEQNRYIGDVPAKIEISHLESIDIKTNDNIYLANMIAKHNNSKSKQINSYSILSKECKHLILDMDGVLIDSEFLMKQSWQNSGGAKFADFSEYKKLVGLPFVDICLKLGIDLKNISILKEKYFKYSREHIFDVILYPKVRETLICAKSRNIKVSVVTSKDYKNAQAILDHFKLNKYIDCLVAPSHLGYTGRHKPFGDPLLYSCVQNQISPNDSIYIGDMISDFQAAKDAGIDFIFAKYGYGEMHNDTCSIDCFDKLQLLFL